MTLLSAIKILEDAGVLSPEYDAREIFRYAENISHFALLKKDFDSKKAEPLIERRRCREPLGYIIGKVGFFREEYEVTPDVLIPRPDTEILVEYATAHIPKGESFADLCTGSGCIAISTLKNTDNTHALAVDISEGALSVARRNAKSNGVTDRITFLKRNLLTEEIPSDAPFYAILSNPPYVTEAEYKELSPEIAREPMGAFLGGEDGMIFYRRLLPLALPLIKPSGFIAFEIGAYQGRAITELSETFSCNVEIIKDYSGLDRVAVIRK